jgi:hypothetical protein
MIGGLTGAIAPPTISSNARIKEDWTNDAKDLLKNLR